LSGKWSGGSFSKSFLTGFINKASSVFNYSSNIIKSSFQHGVVSGVTSKLVGGSFGRGFEYGVLATLVNEGSQNGPAKIWKDLKSFGKSAANWIGRGLGVVGGVGQIGVGAGVVAAGCAQPAALVTCVPAAVGGGALYLKGIDNVQASFRGVDSYSEDFLQDVTGSDTAGTLINAGLDGGASAFGLLRKVPDPSLYYKHRNSLLNHVPAYTTSSGQALMINVASDTATIIDASIDIADN